MRTVIKAKMPHVDIPNPIKRKITNIPKDSIPTPRMTNRAKAPGSKIDPNSYHGLNVNAHMKMV